jgi:peroxiredoxin Q/BCP
MIELKEGDKAPDFNAEDQEGKKVRLSDYKGKKLILYFYPKDDTSGCTAESCNLRDNYPAILKKGYEVIGVSNDTVKSHGKFANKYNLPFTLVADTDKSIVNAYGVYGEKTLFGRKYMGIIRTTFLINEKGYIEKVFRKVETKNHTEQIFNK